MCPPTSQALPLDPSKCPRGTQPQGVGPLQLPKQGPSNCCQRRHKGRKERSEGGKKGGKRQKIGGLQGGLAPLLGG